VPDSVIERIVPCRRRRRLAWKLRSVFQRDAHLRFDGDLDLWSPTNNFTAQQVYVFGQRDPDVFAWLDSFLMPGMVVLDIGANVGAYSLFMSKRISPGGQCHAFEANPRLTPYLLANKENNGLSNLILNPVAVGESRGSTSFVQDAWNLGKAHVGDREGSVELVNIDDYLMETGTQRVDFIKVDIEGYELAALRGASRTLGANTDVVLLVEVVQEHMSRYGFSVADVFRYLNGLGFQPQSLGPQGFVAFSEARDARDVFWSRRPLVAGAEVLAAVHSLRCR
jgi:FkbM family methyltransferase